MIPGTGSAFSGCGVCTGAGVCFGAAAMEVEVAAVFRTLGASACVTGCADFLVSLLSHATRNISPAPRKTIFKRFTKLHFNAGLSSSYLLDGSGRRTAASDLRQPGIRASAIVPRTQRKGPGNNRGHRLRWTNYQVRRKPNWNCRGSKAAVGVPACVYCVFTSATLNRLMKLNMSTSPSSFTRSLNAIVRPILMSVKMVIGRMPALRPRLPARLPVKTPSLGLASTKHGIWNAPVGEALEGTLGKPHALVAVPTGTALGRSVEVLKLKFWSVAVTML